MKIIVQLLVGKDAPFRRPRGENEENIFYGCEEGRLWLDTAFENLHEAQRAFPNETYREIIIEDPPCPAQYASAASLSVAQRTHRESTIPVTSWIARPAQLKHIQRRVA